MSRTKAEPGTPPSPPPTSRVRQLAAWADRHPADARFALAALVAALTVLTVLLALLGPLGYRPDFDHVVWAVVALWFGGGVVAGILLGQRAFPSYLFAHAVATTFGGVTMAFIFLFLGFLGGGDGGGPSSILGSGVVLILVVEAVGVFPVGAGILLGALGRRVAERRR